jgi:DNA polymerase-3 subunit delta'
MTDTYIKGQNKVLNFLIKSLRNNRLAHAYLFIGPDSIGKDIVAKRFAKILNCQNKDFDSCDSCSSCIRIENESHPDIHWIKPDTSGFIRITDIRQLERDIYLKPYEARKKVYIIQDAQCMTEEANNALLKTLEEPPSDSILILISSQPSRIFSTVLSRCQKVYFSLFSAADLEDVLIKDYNLEKKRSRFLARFSGGRLGKALQFKDADILKKRDRIIEDFVYLTDFSRFYSNFKVDSKKEIEGILEILIDWFRDILLVKVGLGSMDLINADRLNDIISLSRAYSFKDLFGIIEHMIKINRLLSSNVNIKIAMIGVKEKICRK